MTESAGARMTTTTMRACFEGDADPNDWVGMLLSGGPWFAPDPDTPACGSVRYVPPAETTDGVERMFVCDLPVDHTAWKHRQVTDPVDGHTIEWAPRGSAAAPRTSGGRHRSTSVQAREVRPIAISTSRAAPQSPSDR